MALYLTDENGKPIQISGLVLSSTKVYNDLDSLDGSMALSAYQGYILNNKITAIHSNIAILSESLSSYYNKNETDLLLKDKASASDIPTKTSELQNDGDGTSSFATEQYVDNNGGKIDSISVNGIKQTIDQTKNVNIEITEYDDTEINRLIGNKVDKEEGKGLSSNDYTTEEKTKLAELNNYEESIANLENNKLDRNEVVSLPVGSIFASAIPQIDARVHLLDGSTISQTGLYKTFADLIKSLVADGKLTTYTQSQFDSDVATYGQCGKFVIDNDAGTIRLPLITEFIASNNGGQEIGLAQLDEFKSHTHIAGYADNNWKLKALAYTEQQILINYDPLTNTNQSLPTTSSGGSETRPKNIRYPYYIVLAAGYKSDQVVDMDNIVAELNDRDSKKDLLVSYNTQYNFAGGTIPIPRSEYVTKYDYLEIEVHQWSATGDTILAKSNIITELKNPNTYQGSATIYSERKAGMVLLKAILGSDKIVLSGLVANPYLTTNASITSADNYYTGNIWGIKL